MAYNMFTVMYEMTLVFGHPDIPTTADYVAQLLKPGIITSILAPPSILEDLSKDPSALQDLAKLRRVAYGGGPVRTETGKALSELVPHFFSFIGATEVGWHHTILGGNELWDSLRWYADIGYELEEISDGIFELVIVNNEQTNKYQGIFEVFPNLKEYRTKDLYSPHPTVPGWWKYRGRADDLIILSNGEKINPIPMENTIRSNPLVKAALVVGEYRFNPSLLIEMENENVPRTDVQRMETLNKIWPTVEKANRIAPGFAKIPKSLILFATLEKPFLRAGKGTVQRQLTVKSYSKELDRLFSSTQNDLLIEGLTLDHSGSSESVKTFTREIYRQALEIDELNDSDDVFNHGVDSLKVLVVVQRFQAAVRASGMSINPDDINARLIYSASSIAKTAEAILGLNQKLDGIEQVQNAAIFSRERKMKELLDQYSRNLPSLISTGKQAKSSAAWNFLLTGTTGSLGTYLLAALENMPRAKVGKIFCLNRSPNAKERQKKSSKARGLKFAWDDKRVEFFHADLSQPDLGLGAEKYASLLDETTVVIHNAWPVNFNLALDSFEPQIRGVRNLLDFSAQSAHRAPLIFVSSISTVHRWMEMHPDEVVPEAVLNDFDAPEWMGYSESKFVSEQLVQAFSRASGVATAIMRNGQIAGPLKGNGVWNKHEWLPSIVTSSKHLGVLPETLGSLEVVDWIPV